MKKTIYLALTILLAVSCSNEDSGSDNPEQQDTGFDFSSILNINFDALPNYENQPIPAYITKDNTQGNDITNEVATLGRILFYDENLSINNTVSCASCHKQELAFGDDNSQSIGVNGVTGRHSMRLVNSRFANESNFFWDERASSLEQQTTMPIKDHIEMGFSGENGDLSFDDLVSNLESTTYYPEIFEFAFGNSEISESKIQIALAHCSVPAAGRGDQG